MSENRDYNYDRMVKAENILRAEYEAYRRLHSQEAMLREKELADLQARHERLRKAAEALHDKLVERCGPYPKWKPEMDALRAALEEEEEEGK